MWRYGQGGTEPTLDEVIHEPVIRLMMERDHVAEETLLRIINIARQHLGGCGRLPPRTGSRPSSCTRTQGRPPDNVNFASTLGATAVRDREDDGIGAFYCSDEGFGYAIGANVDRALLLPLAETVCRQTAGWRQSQACAGTREGQLALITAGWPLTKILQDPQRAMTRPASRCPLRGSRIEQHLYAFHEIFLPNKRPNR